jgi:hypothetical protein
MTENGKKEKRPHQIEIMAIVAWKILASFTREIKQVAFHLLIDPLPNQRK